MWICLTDRAFREFSCLFGLEKGVRAGGVCLLRAARGAAVLSDGAYEADDDAKASYVVTRQEERLVDRTVLRHTEYAVLVVFAFLYSLDEDALACFENIDCSPLKKAYVGDFSAGEQVSAVI